MVTFEKSDHPKTRILTLSGNWDSHFGWCLEPSINQTIKEDYGHLILNLSAVHAIDKTGLSQIFIWYHRLKTNHIKFSIATSFPVVREILEAALLTELLHIYPSVIAALESSPPVSPVSG